MVLLGKAHILISLPLCILITSLIALLLLLLPSHFLRATLALCYECGNLNLRMHLLHLGQITIHEVT